MEVGSCRAITTRPLLATQGEQGCQASMMFLHWGEDALLPVP